MYFMISDQQIDDACSLWRRIAIAERVEPVYSARSRRLYRIATRAWYRYKRLCSKQHFQAATRIKSNNLEIKP